MRPLNLRDIPLLAFLPVCFSCSVMTATVKIPPASGQTEAAGVSSDFPVSPAHEAAAHDDTLDFAYAFTDTVPRRLSRPAIPPARPAAATAVVSLRYPPFEVPGAVARIALRQNVPRVVMYSVGNVLVNDGRANMKFRFRGRNVIDAGRRNDRVVMKTSHERDREVVLPCTLLSENPYNFIEADSGTYRGSFILIADKAGTFTLINYLPVEDYLRGVVPLEMGKRPDGEIEALKAQAVAARTYTYRRMIDRRDSTYDLLPTVMDQVYGGCGVEYRGSDMAVLSTRDLIMVYGNSLVCAYYHSTCGGRTANIEDVWNKSREPYLRSIDDRDGNGVAYCAGSRYSKWDYSWNAGSLSSILSRFASSAGLRGEFHGSVKSINILSRFSCGRIETLKVGSSRGTALFSGDRIRFAFRRDLPGYPLLPSADFEVAGINGSRVSVRGRGYGHGVGMCQVGAMGRARAGQTFEEILLAYYSGVEIRTATPSPIRSGR